MHLGLIRDVNSKSTNAFWRRKKNYIFMVVQRMSLKQGPRINSLSSTSSRSISIGDAIPRLAPSLSLGTMTLGLKAKLTSLRMAEDLSSTSMRCQQELLSKGGIPSRSRRWMPGITISVSRRKVMKLSLWSLSVTPKKLNLRAPKPQVSAPWRVLLPSALRLQSPRAARETRMTMASPESANE